MSVEATATIMRSYLDALLARGEFADYFSDDVTWTIVGTSGTSSPGCTPKPSTAHPKVKTLVVGDGQAALEADFVGTHRVEDDLAFVAPWGVELGSVRVPVAVWHGNQDVGVPAAHWSAARFPSASRSSRAPLRLAHLPPRAQRVEDRLPARQGPGVLSVCPIG